ncbi:ABC transporter ATP-binding protein [Desulfovibrio litoralis]|uniref:Capsular polysaccharide transport system ATP-binding protein n=1 Tax=Desulfovibrio litoralis DSM 11393 TaxID=1121455 RepID=A0A1M7TMZ8_9BACT|nr:ABC transporter ATP-binding protein [Desulfovibrio litoralis]SHN72038.1 capsular polysaccharide transport system ATP-binding protein [Desulfovibrio litoralis DSM 11393]
MIKLANIYKSYKTKHGRKIILDDVSYDFKPGINTGILGPNGTGKSTLIRIIGGSEPPDKGEVIRNARISWPLGFAGGFNSKLSGRENMRFICRLFNKPFEETVAYVEDFSELGEYMDMPVYTYSSGMNAKLTFGLSMAFHFDYYLIDEVTAVGDASFREKCDRIFKERIKTATLIVVSHSMNTIKNFCSKVIILSKGKFIEYDDLDLAAKDYQELCKRKK